MRSFFIPLACWACTIHGRRLQSLQEQIQRLQSTEHTTRPIALDALRSLQPVAQVDGVNRRSSVKIALNVSRTFAQLLLIHHALAAFHPAASLAHPRSLCRCSHYSSASGVSVCHIDQHTLQKATPRTSAPSGAVAARSAAIVGGGPAGLLTAMMLAQRGWEQINVYDALQPPPPPGDPQWGAGERSYQLGLNGRGQKALRQFGALERVESYAASVNGRLSFGEDGKPIENRFKPPGTPGADKSYVTRVMQRDRLQACLLEEIAEKYPQVNITFGVAFNGVDVSGEKPMLQLCAPAGDPEDGCKVDDPVELSSPVDLLVGADGVRSAVRESLAAAPNSRTRTVRFKNNNERVYRTLPLHPSAIAGTSSDLNWGLRNSSKDIAMDALPTMEGEMVAVLLFKPSSPVSLEIERLSSGADVRNFIAEALPALLPYCRDDELERFAKRPTSRLPCFQLVKGDIHRSLPQGGVVLLGDAIKAVKPYFGQGVNSAFEDVKVLAGVLDSCPGDMSKASAAYSRARGDDARALVRISRGFDMPGPIGTARFLVPLLLDRTLNSLLPAIFSPPVLRGLQDDRNSFVGLRWKKRWERALLFAMLGALLTAARHLGALILRAVVA